MSTAIRRSLPFALLLLCIGCNGTSFDFQGKWSGNRNLHPPGVDKYTAYSAGMVELLIKPDGKFELQQAGVPTSGTVSVEGAQATLTTTHIMGQPLEVQGPNAEEKHPPITLSVTEGSLSFSDPSMEGGKPVRLKREQALATASRSGS